MAPDDDDDFLARLRAEAARVDMDEIRAELESALEHPDPVLAELVAGALRKYEHALTPAGVEEVRRLLIASVLADPEARRLLDVARAQKGSGTVKKPSAQQIANAPTKKAGRR
jgi:hypothetical protein